jgi:hypothetical protein
MNLPVGEMQGIFADGLLLYQSKDLSKDFSYGLFLFN